MDRLKERCAVDAKTTALTVLPDTDMAIVLDRLTSVIYRRVVVRTVGQQLTLTDVPGA